MPTATSRPASTSSSSSSSLAAAVASALSAATLAVAALTTALLPVGPAWADPAAAPSPTSAPSAAGAVGSFAGHADVGKVGTPGAAAFDGAAGAYRVTGCGANMWAAADAFHFVRAPAAGDLSVEAVVRLDGTTGNPHRKAGLMVRQPGAAADAAYADVVVHGDGTVALQYRAAAGGPTANASLPGADGKPAEAKPADAKPATGPAAAAAAAAKVTIPVADGVPVAAKLRLERRGDAFNAFVSVGDGPPRPVGSVRLVLTDPVDVGLAVCSHDAAATTTAVFADVAFKSGERPAAGEPGGAAVPGAAPKR